ncbi:hypothetical protein, partial [Paraburkholderia caribensis]
GGDVGGPWVNVKNWRCEPLSFAYFSLRRQRKVGAAPHRGDAWSELTIRGCQRKQIPKHQTTMHVAAAKKSKFRPAQGRRVKRANKTRMPSKANAKTPNNDACCGGKEKKSRCHPAQGQRIKQDNASRLPAKKQNTPTGDPMPDLRGKRRIFNRLG